MGGDFMGFLVLGFFCSRRRKAWLDPAASGYKSCSNSLQHWLFHGLMPMYFFNVDLLVRCLAWCFIVFSLWMMRPYCSMGSVVQVENSIYNVRTYRVQVIHHNVFHEMYQCHSTRTVSVPSGALSLGSDLTLGIFATQAEVLLLGKM